MGLVILVILFYALLKFALLWGRKRISEKALIAFNDGNWDAFQEILSSKWARIAVSNFTRTFYELNFAISQLDRDHVERCLETFDGMRMHPQQRFEVLLKLYEFELVMGKPDQVKAALEALDSFVHENRLPQGALIRDKLAVDRKLFVEQDITILPTINQIIDESDPSVKALWHFYRAGIYRRNDRVDDAIADLKVAYETEHVEAYKRRFYSVLQELLTEKK